MRPTPYVASLRIYEPLTSFSPVDQLRWSSIPIESYTGREEQDRALRRVILAEPPHSKQMARTSLITMESAMSRPGQQQRDVGLP